MRTLVVSIGNSSIRGGLFEGQRLTGRFRLPYDRAGKPTAAVRALQGRLPRQADSAVLCSVVPAFTRPVADAIRRRTGLRPGQLSSASRHGLAIDYGVPAKFGADRLACALGAVSRFPGRDLIVVDCGTATTLTAVARSGRVLGGAILPGQGLWFDALHRSTARLPRVHQRERQVAALGQSPEAAIRAGVTHGHAGAIRELVRLVGAEAFGRRRPVVVATGGGLEALPPGIRFTAREPDLILLGLFTFATQSPAHA
jgi:type III pantothenate kinase